LILRHYPLPRYFFGFSDFSMNSFRCLAQASAVL
jgi:hypothetical protein